MFDSLLIIKSISCIYKILIMKLTLKGVVYIQLQHNLQETYTKYDIFKIKKKKACLLLQAVIV